VNDRVAFPAVFVQLAYRSDVCARVPLRTRGFSASRTFEPGVISTAVKCVFVPSFFPWFFIEKSRNSRKQLFQPSDVHLHDNPTGATTVKPSQCNGAVNWVIAENNRTSYYCYCCCCCFGAAV